MRRTITRAGVALLASAWLVAAAQSPAFDPGQADLAKAQAAQQLSQPLNNQPVWQEVRSGTQQYTSLPGRETSVLIQPEGQTWRAVRNGQASVYGGWLLVVVVLSIAAYYWRRGSIPLSEPPTGRKVRRFTTGERVIHWATAIAFVALAVSGLVILFGKNVLLPLIGYTLFSWLALLAKNLHNFVGPVFVVCTILMFLAFVRDNVWQQGDAEWIRKGGGLLKGEHVPSHRFNFGEKSWFWFGVVFLGIVVGVSGLVLNFPNFEQTRATMQIANIVHLVAAIVFICLSLGHIYMGTVGVDGALESMRSGYVDETWAKEHHEYWYNDIKAGKIPAGDEAELPMRHRPA
ncbi:MAG: formate dehydrogenase subunit gamma [Betaproteobacteria bacterium]|nr:formate dehydrogenase subunit gamma [Betaproteobacteria bacterium]